MPTTASVFSLSPAPEVQLHYQRVAKGEPAALVLSFACGSHDEPATWLGMAHFMEHLVFRGSANFTAEDSLMAFVQQAGGRVNARTSARQTCFHFEIDAGQLLPAAERLVDMLVAPEFAESSLLSEREVLDQEHGMYSRMPLAHFQASVGALLQHTHPLQKFYAGHAGTLGVEQPGFLADLRSYHRKACLHSPLQIGLCLPIEAELNEVLGCLQPLLQQPRHEQRELPPPLTLPREQLGRLQMAGAGNGWLLHLAFNQQATALAPLALCMQQAFAALPGAGAGWQCLPVEPFAEQGVLSLWLPADVSQGPAKALAKFTGWLQAWQQYVQRPEVQQLQGLAAKHLAGQASSLDTAMQLAGCSPQAVLDQAVLTALDTVLEKLEQGDFALLEVVDEPGASNFDQGLALALQQQTPSPLPAWQPVAIACPEHPLKSWLLTNSEQLADASVLPQLLPPNWPAQRAWLYWAWQLSPCAEQLQQLQRALQGMAQAWAGHGVSWQLEAWPNVLLLSLQGAADCLAAAANALLEQLTNVQLHAPTGQLPTPPPGGFALRRLLQMLPTLLQPAGNWSGQGLSAAPQSALWLGEQGDLPRLQQRWLQALNQPIQAQASVAQRKAAQWFDVSEHFAGNSESLLVLYRAASSPLQAQLWSCAASLLEPLLQQDLRSQQGLCYAVFARAHQHSGQQGLCLAIQSSQLAAEPLRLALLQSLHTAVQLLLTQPEALLDAWQSGRQRTQQGQLPVASRAELLLAQWYSQGCSHKPALALPVPCELGDKQLPALLEPLLQSTGWWVLANATQS